MQKQNDGRVKTVEVVQLEGEWSRWGEELSFSESRRDSGPVQRTSSV